MYTKGLMDGWHGDENYCDGQCGLCDECEQITEQKGDIDYESWRDDQIFNASQYE